MSSDDQDRRKTLTVKKTARDAHAAAGDTKRKRSGARARTAALIERSKDQAQRLRRNTEDTPAAPRGNVSAERGKPVSRSRASGEFDAPRRPRTPRARDEDNWTDSTPAAAGDHDAFPSDIE